MHRACVSDRAPLKSPSRDETSEPSDAPTEPGAAC